ncbi:MAG TPA: Dam family site-specific DNA-(adenine-N6)-methyltransferase [Bacillota bacterium]|mgnify:CR=1 FL=1|nr:Dam family site-specific DNA-(adenine-N6)-methyltransferase [Bacillota bacterium]HPT88305.1 Dam family site-specific DNA-(adenine-N6)-methyltransferase [Bacillota bacterium]
MRPFLKWAGGKYRLTKRINEKLPPGNRLLEPFAGSCAVSLNADYPDYWLNDINPDLINLYQTLQQHGWPFIEVCRQYFIPANNTPEKYYELRDRFNRETDPVIKAALFLYLNRHGYNGLSRYNQKGHFNVPFGRFKKPYFPETELHYFYKKFRHAQFTAVDFEEIILSAQPGDVIYCDPPYAPINQTSNFTSYSAGGFNQAEQLRLANVAAIAASKGVTVVISNHYSNFVMEIYSQANIETFPVRRLISCNGERRRQVDEVLAVFEPLSHDN